jgi:two-component system, NarL family, nitrate/nitrite response regulator NarL
MSTRILLVDDSALTRGLVRAFLESRPGFEVCGEASDGEEGIRKGEELEPDVVVLDFYLPCRNGLQVAVILHEALPSTPIILFTLYKEEMPIHTAKAAGVASVLSKTGPLTELAEEVQRLTRWEN